MSMTDTEAAPFDLPAARALCDAATPEPWIVDGGTRVRDPSDHWLLAWCDNDGTAAFIVAARTLLPAALDEIERLRKALMAEMGARTMLRFEAVTALNEACAASYSDADRYVVQHDLLQATRCRARANAFNDAARIVDDIHRKDPQP